MSTAGTFRLLESDFVVARLSPDAAVETSWMRGEFWSVTRTSDELSVVTTYANAPVEAQLERGWRALQLLGPIAFETTGVAASFTGALARNGISVFVISTYDTDYLLVKEASLAAAIEALEAVGYAVVSAAP